MNPLDAQDIVATLGTLGVLTALFIETGLLIGLLLPGDSLLFIAGLAASGTAKELFGNQLSYISLMIWAPIFATAGSQFGHWLGAKYGRPFLDRPNSKYFKQSYVRQTEHWLLKYGLGKALLLSHFIPFVRTLLNPLCGIVGIPARTFFVWNVIASSIWTSSLISLGFFLGEKFKFSVEKYIFPTVIIIVAISLLPLLRHIMKKG